MENLFLVAAFIVAGIIIGIGLSSDESDDKKRKRKIDMSVDELHQEYYRLIDEVDDLFEKKESLEDAIEKIKQKNPEQLLKEFPKEDFDQHIRLKKQMQDVNLQIAKNRYKRVEIRRELTIRDLKQENRE